MKNKQYLFYFRIWLNKCKSKCEKFMIPLIVFQSIRTIIFPSILDLLLLLLLISLAVLFKFQWI